MIRIKNVAALSLALIISAPATLSVAQERVRHGDLVIEKPWARASIGTSRPAAAYLTIRNEGKITDTLLRIYTALSTQAEVHAVTDNNGVMGMSPAGQISIPARGSISLAPGGLHIMMMGLKAPLVKGQAIEITLSFERAGDITVSAPILGPGATQPE